MADGDAHYLLAEQKALIDQLAKKIIALEGRSAHLIMRMDKLADELKALRVPNVSDERLYQRDEGRTYQGEGKR